MILTRAALQPCTQQHVTGCVNKSPAGRTFGFINRRHGGPRSQISHPQLGPMWTVSLPEGSRSPKGATLASSGGVVASTNAADGSDSFVENGYLLMSVLAAAVGCVYLIAPDKPLAVASIVVTPYIEYMTRCMGELLLVTAVFLYCVKDAAANGDLGASPHKDLAMWTVLSNAAAVIMLLFSSLSLPAWALLFKVSIPVVLLVLYWKAYKNFPILAVAPAIVDGVKSIFKVENLKALAFSIATAANAAAAVLMAVRPDKAWQVYFASASLDSVAAYVTRVLGVFLGTMAIANSVLKDGADRNTLGDGTQQKILLVVGLFFLMEAGFVTFVYPDLLRPIAKIVVGATGAFYSLLCFYLFFTEKTS